MECLAALKSLSLYIATQGRLVKCLVAGLHDSRGWAGVTNGPVSLRCRCFGGLNVVSTGVYGVIVAVDVNSVLREGLSSCPGNYVNTRSWEGLLFVFILYLYL